jgi:predicted nucleic acid-binding Zn finger protein
MKPEQQKRYDKIYTDEFYLIDHTPCNINTEFYEFTISGSTRKVYKVKLYNTGDTVCSCPDFFGHAKKAGCICKHVCFVFAKVLKYNLTDIYESNKFKYLTVKNICETLQVDTALINLSINDEYFNQPDFTIFKELFETDECPICFSEFKNNEKKIGCPQCSNAIHLKCMEKWLSYKLSCPYCRSEVWKKYVYK